MATSTKYFLLWR
uniref:Uncharacterized protein n=1 Tax=Anguilla anguilla TaxID=7936 RepID=A0A0E9RTT0_ANGAN